MASDCSYAPAELRERVTETVDPRVMADFRSYAVERVVRAVDNVDPSMVDRAVDDIVTSGTYSLKNDALYEAVSSEMDRMVEEYEDDELFTLQVPEHGEPFHREFYRTRGENGQTNGFKEVYLGPGDDDTFIALVPKFGDSVRDRAERVVTWLHDVETYEGNGLEVPSRYWLAMAEKNGEPMPALVGRNNTSMTMVENMAEDQVEAVQDDIAEASQTLSSLVHRGVIASARMNDFYGPMTEKNQAYDFEAGHVVVPELGELFDPMFEKEEVQVDSREEFLAWHDIDKRVDRWLSFLDIDPSRPRPD